jgi:hypothetical protein
MFFAIEVIEVSLFLIFRSSFTGIPVVVTIIFVVLKLMKKIKWSWLLVTSPTWIPIIAGMLWATMPIIKGLFQNQP